MVIQLVTGMLLTSPPGIKESSDLTNEQPTLLQSPSNSFTVTNISHDPKNTARSHYDEQIERNLPSFDFIQDRLAEDWNRPPLADGGWAWTSDHCNKTIKGDYFVFALRSSLKYEQEGLCKIHMVEDVSPPSAQLLSWRRAKKANLDKRDVLRLSPPIFELSIREWESMGGPKELSFRGTRRYNGSNFKEFLIQLHLKRRLTFNII